jgi:ribosomal protein S18 acetylase RimI-like enzyme
MSLSVRPINQEDAEICGKIGFEAHKTISSTHGYPSEQPSVDFAIGLICMLLDNPSSWGVLAERNHQIVGSIFLHAFPPSPIAAIGPLTVLPSAEGGVGRALMDAALDEAKKRKFGQVRLVQSPSHIRSFVLYTKTGFILREPLFLMQGAALAGRNHQQGYNVRAALNDDILRCNDVCRSIHGFVRDMELRQAIAQGVAAIVERDGEITGYSAGIGILCHSVARTNEDLKALIGSAPVILGPGFLVPGRNHEILTWLLHSGFRIGWPASLMSVGDYEEPTGPFLPSLAY